MHHAVHVHHVSSRSAGADVTDDERGRVRLVGGPASGRIVRLPPSVTVLRVPVPPPLPSAAMLDELDTPIAVPVTFEVVEYAPSGLPTVWVSDDADDRASDD